ncbi:tRNA pseudouridine(55) synthase TruB [Cellulomonas bogoriensis]|uniref:tRNA pseudouridine synthase B n=1 Tax=Cellulomonas bogoriensis 69B4 = DSM 16987 TaxID=1386082 RepID=A0A0A0BZ69_9CELL|nr:tRNA pseudouridine(55) synthase TruB [Cellulomonas bogoriensis]KGM13201.1 tRNA pseudouridine synthase B [Cellulomonas bogoriensis 69B4 = DSM 16987]
MAEDGLVVVDKPDGWTSHDVVGRLRRLLGTRKIGHAGTLDPMATGVLVCGVERGTRLLTYLVGAQKSYVATVRLGMATTTDDAEGEVVGASDATGVTDAALAAVVDRLRGPIMQVPSAVSAIKVDGRRAYARVRDGEQVELAARPVTVHALDVGPVRPADVPSAVDVDLDVTCSSGTYVRALARDIGAALGVGGHLTRLRRTRVGSYGLDVACTLEQLQEDPATMPLARAARALLVARELDEAEARELSFGRRIRSLPAVRGSAGEPVAAFAPDGRLVALLKDQGGWARPVLVTAPA